jgi:WD40 repeat protein
MAAGVAGSTVFLLLLTRGVLQRPFCQAELVAALDARRPLLLLHEADPSRGGAPLEELLREGDNAVTGAPSHNSRRLRAPHMAALRAAAARSNAVVPFLRGSDLDAKTLPTLLAALRCTADAAPPPPALYRLRRRALPVPGGAHVALLAAPEGYDQCAAIARALQRQCPHLVARCLHDWEAPPADLAAGSAGGVLLLTARVWEDGHVSAAVAAFRKARRPLRLLHEADPRHSGVVAFGDILQATPDVLRSGADGGLFGSCIAELLERRKDKRGLMLDALLRSSACGALRQGDASAAGLRAAPPPLPWSFRRAPVATPLAAAAAALSALDGPAVLALAGAGGTGKSGIAAALVREPAVRAAFDDVLWLTLGAAMSSPAALLAKLADALAAAADGDDCRDGAPDLSAALADVPSATAALAALLARRPLLVVADDAPSDAAALRALLDALPPPPPGEGNGAWSRLLLTTRDACAAERAAARAGLPAGDVRGGFRTMSLPLLSRAAAAALLADVAGVAALGSPATSAAAGPLERLAALAGATPLSLGLVGGALRTHVEKPGLASPSAAAAAIAEADALAIVLSGAPLPASLASSASAATFRAVDAALRASFAAADIEKYHLVGALPPKAPAPFALLTAAWRMPAPRCAALLRALQASALLKFDAPADAPENDGTGGVVSLHDLQAEFAAAALAARGVAEAAHAHLLSRARAACGMSDEDAAWAHPPRRQPPQGGDDVSEGGGAALSSYVWDHAPLHLAASGRPGEACALLTRLGYLQGLLARRGAVALLAQFAAPWAAADEECRLVAAALRLSPVLRATANDAHTELLPWAAAAAALPAQLAGRLGAFRAPAHPRLAVLVAAARDARGPTPALMPRQPSMVPPGAAEEALLTGHAGAVTALVGLPGGALLSASADATLRLWSPRDAACTALLEGHTSSIVAVAHWAWSASEEDAATDDDDAAGQAQRVYIASLSSDGELRLWSGADGTAEGPSLRAHPAQLAASPTALAACTVPSGAVVILFAGDAAGGVAACALSRPAGAAWAARWSAAAQLPRTYANEAPTVLCAVAASTAAAEHPTDLQLRRSLMITGHCADAAAVWAVDVHPSGDIAPAPPTLLRLLLGHTGWVTSAVLTPAGALVTASWDRMLRLWSQDALAAAPLADHFPAAARVMADSNPGWRRTRGATAATVLADGSAAVGGYQSGQIAVWPLSPSSAAAYGDRAGAPPARLLQAGAAAVTALAALPDGRAASGSADGLVRLWGLLAREAPRPHGAAVTAAVAVGAHLLATAGNDGAVCVWDARSGALRLRARRPGSFFSCMARAGEAEAGEDGVCGLFLGDWAGICVRRLDLPRLLLEHGVDPAVAPAVAAATAPSVDIPARLMSRIVPVMSAGRPEGLAPLARGRLAGCGWNHMLNVWDPALLVAAAGAVEGSEEEEALLHVDRALAGKVIVAELKGHTDYVMCCVALPWRSGGDALLSGSRDTTLRVWEAATPGDDATWACSAVLRCHDGPVTALLALSAAKRAVSASEDGTLCIWELSGSGDDALLLRSRPFGSPVLSLVLAVAGMGGAEVLALWAGTAAGVLHLVDAATGRVLLRDAGVADAAPVRALAVSPAGGGCLLAATARGEVHTYALLAAAETEAHADETTD